MNRIINIVIVIKIEDKKYVENNHNNIDKINKYIFEYIRITYENISRLLKRKK